MGHAEIAELLLAAGANAEARGQNGKTALDLAREQRNIEVMAVLEPVQRQ